MNESVLDIKDFRSYLKNTSNAQLRCCGPPQNVLLIPPLAGLRFFVGPRPRVGGITHLIVLIKVCLLSLNVICIFEIASRFCATGYDPANPLFLLTESTDSFKCRRKFPIFCENVFTKMGNSFHTRVEPNDKGGHKLLQSR
jgi:hypothetical protein